jgi:hypothetical protein
VGDFEGGRKKKFLNYKMCWSSKIHHFEKRIEAKINKLIKEKTTTKETRKTKGKDRSPNKRSHPKAQNTQWGALRAENMGPKPITSSMKQVEKAWCAHRVKLID